jgi:hypothetical protein
MLSATYDLHYLQAGLDQLESYLLSKDIYRPIGIQSTHGQPPYPQLTLGWLLLARQRLQATAQTQSEQLELDHLSQQLDALRSHWLSAWRKKAQAEFRARLNLWRDYLEEYRQNPASNLDRYAYEVNRRLLLELLAHEAAVLSEADMQALAGLDSWLKATLVHGAFIWEPILTASFPESTYWYLYGKLPDFTENKKIPPKYY